MKTFKILCTSVTIEPDDDTDTPRTSISVVVDPVGGNYLELSQERPDMDFIVHKIEVDYEEWDSIDKAVRMLMDQHRKTKA